MMEQIYPLFHSGRILRQEMLEALSDYSYRFGELLYSDYADGIISGCALTTSETAITLHPGILCLVGKVFLVKEPMSIAYGPTDATCILRMCYVGEAENESFIAHTIDLRLDEEPSLVEGQIELCRFKLQTGARLRGEYVDFEDRSTEYDTLNTIHSTYAALGQGTLHPEIIKSFAREMLSYSLENPVDISFCLDALGRPGPVCAEVIAAYIKLRTSQHDLAESNGSLYNGLLQILKDVKSGSHAGQKPVAKPRRTILID